MKEQKLKGSNRTDLAISSDGKNYLLHPSAVLSADAYGHEDNYNKIIHIACTNERKGRLLQVNVYDTSALYKRFSAISERYEYRISVLREVILSQKKLIEYNGIYNAFLIGSISEEEFYKEADRFSYEPVIISNEELSKKIEYLHADTNIEFSPADLMEIFQSTLTSVETALTFLEDKKTSKISHD